MKLKFGTTVLTVVFVSSKIFLEHLKIRSMKDLYLGIDLGGSGMRSAVYDNGGNLEFQLEDINFNSEISNGALFVEVGFAIENARRLSAKRGLGLLLAWGLASPGPLDPFNGVIETPPNLKVRNFAVVKELESSFPDVKGFLLNDADAALLAECRFGGARDFNNVVGVFAGTGLGTSVVSQGRLKRGQGKGGGWGHTSMYGFGQKRKCVCGRINCIETFIGTLGLAQTYCQIFKKDYNNLSREEIFNISIKVRDELRNKTGYYDAYKSVVGAYALHFLEALKNIICVHNPECIILGGGVIKNNRFLVSLLNRRVRLIDDDTKPLFENVVIKLQECENPGTLGAACYAMDGINRYRLDHGIYL